MNRTAKRLTTLVLAAAMGLMLGAAPASAVALAHSGASADGRGGCCGL